MDLVQSFWSLFVWILAMGKIQKEPGSIPKGLEFSYNGKSGMIPNYVTTPLSYLGALCVLQLRLIYVVYYKYLVHCLSKIRKIDQLQMRFPPQPDQLGIKTGGISIATTTSNQLKLG